MERKRDPFIDLYSWAEKMDFSSQLRIWFQKWESLVGKASCVLSNASWWLFLESKHLPLHSRLLKKNNSNKQRPPPTHHKTFSPPSQWAGAVPWPQLLVIPKRLPQGESGLPRGDLGTSSLDTWKNLDPCLTSSWLDFFYPHSGMFPGSDLRSVPPRWPISLVFPYIQESTINSLDEMKNK